MAWRSTDPCCDCPSSWRRLANRCCDWVGPSASEAASQALIDHSSLDGGHCLKGDLKGSCRSEGDEIDYLAARDPATVRLGIYSDPVDHGVIREGSRSSFCFQGLCYEFLEWPARGVSIVGAKQRARRSYVA